MKKGLCWVKVWFRGVRGWPRTHGEVRSGREFRAPFQAKVGLLKKVTKGTQPSLAVIS